MKILEKLFCLHKWKTHATQPRVEYGYGDSKHEYTLEVLICEKCGKIKKIMY